MRDDSVHTEDYKGFKIKVYQDELAENPYDDWNMLGKFYHWHKRGFFGESLVYQRTNGMTPEDIIKEKGWESAIIVPVYLYEHSGQTISTGPFGCPWDSGCVGLWVVTREEALKEFGGKILTKALKEKVNKLIESQVKSIDRYLTGQVYGFVAEDKDGEQIDSCWGFYNDYDDEYMIGEAKSSIDYHLKEKGKERINKLKTLIKNRVPLDKRSQMLAA